MKKSVPDMSLPWSLQGWSSWSKKMQIYLKNYDLSEYVDFGAISWKSDILTKTASIKFESKNSFAHVLTHIIVIICSTAPFVSTWPIFNSIKRAKTRRLFFRRTIGSNNYFTLIENNFWFLRYRSLNSW